MTDEKIIDRIRKLLALAERAGTPEEAELAFERAQDLMVKHAIEEHRLAGAGGTRSEQIVSRVVPVSERDEIRKAKRLLLAALAKANRCRAYASTQSGGIVIVGYESEAEFVELLYATVLMQLAGERTRAWKAYRAETPPVLQESRHLFVTGFAVSYAARVGGRLEEAARRSEGAQEPGSALVLRDRTEDVNAFMAGINLTTTTLKLRSGTAAAAAGIGAADRADLSGGRGHLRTHARELGQ